MKQVPVDDFDLFRRLLVDADALLLDFDGPVCSVFAGYPAPVIAAELRTLIHDAGELPPPEADANDPHTILGYAAELSPALGRQIEAALQAGEIEAAKTATPTPGAAELMATWHATDRPLAIVSNNTTEAIRGYLAAHDLSTYVDHIQGRDPYDPTLMKPNAHLLTEAAKALDVDAAYCVLIGDSTTDVQAAHALEVPAIAYADKPGKHDRLVRAAPALLLTTFTPSC
ncbi:MULTISPECIES: HAD family hydrolase [Actinoalloteichus]|uniref:Haloacid dehalogenase superfamily enzyme, subfamily IA n=1 Tax=Actinoalloteichus fjordicus TaxID=1612552 RepID=A0AAC9PVI6_9PSEU|nr:MULTISPECIES: HAD-IA family hydrolase [Actinoalloteichus]APU17946.1 haloacid dehalogenase superfamily enzyme, subfamily IA [Actinoalloteichus fjordicus]APU24025.1 haloacid dehalogenase superfamily enzyme, subfamily IA [Actinoalloteichus sp. GBA129-24]